MRPLFFDFPSDPGSAAIDDEFLFGPDILVAPVLEYEARKRKVYLPAGTDWTDAWTDKKFAGGQYLEVDAPLEKIPVFLRAGIKQPLINNIKQGHELEGRSPLSNLLPRLEPSGEILLLVKQNVEERSQRVRF